MNTEKTKDTEKNDGCADSGCNPAEFMKMFENMGGCCLEKKGSFDCSDMMKSMMAKCCGTKSDIAKTGCDKKTEETTSDCTT